MQQIYCEHIFLLLLEVVREYLMSDLIVILCCSLLALFPPDDRIYFYALYAAPHVPSGSISGSISYCDIF